MKKQWPKLSVEFLLCVLFHCPSEWLLMIHSINILSAHKYHNQKHSFIFMLCSFAIIMVLLNSFSFSLSFHFILICLPIELCNWYSASSVNCTCKASSITKYKALKWYEICVSILPLLEKSFLFLCIQLRRISHSKRCISSERWHFYWVNWHHHYINWLNEWATFQTVAIVSVQYKNE